MKKYKYNISNLDCANCAKKIEMALNKHKQINNAIINFNTLKLTIETDYEKPLELVQKIVSKIEPDVKIYEKELKTNNTSLEIIRLLIGIALALIGLFTKSPFCISDILVIIAYFILLYRTMKTAFKLLIKSHTINENLLITISCVGAYLMGEHMEGLMVIILYEIGKILEAKAVDHSRKSIKALMDIKPEYANRKIQNNIKIVPPEQIKINDIIVVKKGEKVPLDGVVIGGTSFLDTSTLTGESNLSEVEVGSNILSGSINVGDVLEIKVTETYENSTVNKILELVENATDRKAKTETFVAKLARIYTPIVLLLAIITATFLPWFGYTIQDSIYKALIFLVISCPCAIAISVPLSYFSGIGASSKQGILIKGSDYLDNLSNIKEIVFDKTGTITTGEFQISEIVSLDKKFSKQEILKIIAKGESFSTHPLAHAILSQLKFKVDTENVTNFKEKAGNGFEYQIGDNKYKVGNQKFVGYKSTIAKSGTTIFLSCNSDVIGYIILQDSIKKNTKEVFEKLKKQGIKIKMFTGDNEIHAQEIAKKLDIQYKANLLPNDKFIALENILKEYENTNYKVAFVGDGINDAPVIAKADIGISMGGIGSNAAIETSDIVIMNDDLNNINKALNISKKTKKVIKQNLIFALGVKIVILLFSIFGMAGMWQAVFADVGVTLITILNTLRILKNN